MFHTVAYQSTQSATAETDNAPITDGILQIQNNHFLPQTDMKCLYAAAFGATITRARLLSPSLRQIASPTIRPLQPSIAGADLTRLADYSSNPFAIKGLEELQALSFATSAVQATVVLGLSRSGMMPAPQGNVFVMRGTGATTLAVSVWNQVAVTWSDTLPAGQYVCVGLEAFGATLQAARLTFENQWERPGCVACATAVQAGNSIFRYGRLGVWGNFTSFRMPTVECLANAADTTEEFYLHLIRVG